MAVPAAAAPEAPLPIQNSQLSYYSQGLPKSFYHALLSLAHCTSAWDRL